MSFSVKPHIAVFVDAENQRSLNVRQMLIDLDEVHCAVERHGYGDWRNHRLNRPAADLSRAHFELRHVWSAPSAAC